MLELQLAYSCTGFVYAAAGTWEEENSGPTMSREYHLSSDAPYLWLSRSLCIVFFDGPRVFGGRSIIVALIAEHSATSYFSSPSPLIDFCLLF